MPRTKREHNGRVATVHRPAQVPDSTRRRACSTRRFCWRGNAGSRKPSVIFARSFNFGLTMSKCSSSWVRQSGGKTAGPKPRRSLAGRVRSSPTTSGPE